MKAILFSLLAALSITGCATKPYCVIAQHQRGILYGDYVLSAPIGTHRAFVWLIKCRAHMDNPDIEILDVVPEPQYR